MAKIEPDGIAHIFETLPETFAAYRALGQAVWTEGTLDVQLKELLRLKSAESTNCQH